MKHTLTFETPLPCSAKTLFDFHADTNNLPRITPKDTSVKILKLETPLKEGNEVVLRIKKGWLAFTWKLNFEKVQSPHIIIDVGTRSPFKIFRHEHHFIEVDARHCVLKDKIIFTLPFEPFSNVILRFIKKDITKMFAYRHEQTSKYLSHDDS